MEKMSQCISDRCFNYLQQIRTRMSKELSSIENEHISWESIIRIYKDLRVDQFLGNHNPRTISAGIFYLVYAPVFVDVTLRDFAEIVESNENTISKKVNLIGEYLIKNNSYIPLDCVHRFRKLYVLGKKAEIEYYEKKQKLLIETLKK